MKIDYTEDAEIDIKRHLDKAKAFSIYLYETKKKNLKTEIEKLTPTHGEPLSEFLEEYLVEKYHVTPDYRVAFENPFVIFFRAGDGEILVIRIYDRIEDDRDWVEKISELITLIRQ
jgi:hypothetical protein